jgi:predicted acyltransferase
MSDSAEAVAARPGRQLAIDQFRGLAIFMMLPANYMEHIRVVPAWLKHAPDVWLTIIDFIAPFFIFAIGLTFGSSVRRRMSKDGPQRTLEHVIKRALALIGLGMLFSVGEHSYGFNGDQLWGTLQAIGVAIALTLQTLWLAPLLRLGLALGVMAGYQALLGNGWLEVVVAASHGGIQGSLSWAALLMCATVYADLRASPGRYFSVAGLMMEIGRASCRERVS